MVHFPQDIFSLILSYNKKDDIKDKARQLKQELVKDIYYVMYVFRHHQEQAPYDAVEPPFMYRTPHRFQKSAIFKFIENDEEGTSNEDFIISWVMGDAFFSYDQEGNIIARE